MSWSYVDSDCTIISWDVFYVWFEIYLSKIQSHNGAGWLCGTTMNVATDPELVAYKERDSG